MVMKKVRWGVLSTARIGVEKVIPAMQLSEYCDVAAIASRSLEKAQAVAGRLGIPTAYGSYEELLADSDVDAVYIPLPNHLHVPWSIKALEAGKHVLCEKPIGLTVAEAEELQDVARKQPKLKVMEAFMYRHHPQLKQARQFVDEGKIGALKVIQSFFSYYNVDPRNIRNMADIGGGELMDIGCYCISIARFIFGSEPQRVWGVMEYDPGFKTDRHASGGYWTLARGFRRSPVPRSWRHISGSTSLARRGGSRSRFHSMLPPISPAGYGINAERKSRKSSWTFATSTQYKVTCSPWRCSTTWRCRRRWRMLWPT